MCIPPISTLFASLRAYWVNWRGAVAWTICRHIPRGNRTRSPWTSAPASRSRPERVLVAAELDADLLEDRVGVVLDDREALLAEDLERGQRAGEERQPLDLVAEADGAPALAATGAPVAHALAHRSSPGPGRAGVAAVPRRPAAARGGPPAPAFRPGVAATVGRDRPGRQRDDPLEIGAGGRPVRDRHRLDEMLLEPRLDRGLDLLDAADDGLDLAPGGARQQGDQRAGAGRVAGRPDARQVAVRDEAKDHRVERVDLAAERPGQADLVDGLDLEVVHEQPDAGVQRGLGELDRANVVLGHEDPGPVVGGRVQDVAERPAVRHDPLACARRARHR